jgi:hypothetical protein
MYIRAVIFLIIIMILFITISLLFNIPKSFEPFTLEKHQLGDNTFDDILLRDSFPIIRNNSVSNQQASKMWWHYPIFEVGSYDQITNNIKYPNNPDIGTCTAANFCGTLYKMKQNKSNYIKQLPPASTCRTRVNYYNTDYNLQ